MRRNILFLSFLLLLAAGVAILLVDPGGWLGREAAPPLVKAAPPPAAGADTPLEPAMEPAVAAAEDPAARAEIAPIDGQDFCALVLVDEHGAALPELRLLLCREDRILLRAETDGHGRVEAAADSLPAVLFATAAGRPIQRLELVLLPGAQTLVLPEGGVVAGRITNTEEFAVDGTSLFLRSDHPLHRDGLLPAEVLDGLGWSDRFRSNALSVRLGPGGTFRFAGLPTGWTGELAPRGGLVLASASAGALHPSGTSLRLDRPVADLALALRAEPGLRGTLVHAGSRAPAAGVDVRLRYFQPNVAAGSAGEQRTMAHTEGDGSFTLRLDRCGVADLERIELRLGGDPAGPPLYRAEGSAIPAGGDLGEIEVAGLRDVPFLLLARDGTPVAGAIVKAGSTRSQPSGADGSGVVRDLPRAVGLLRVEADGFVPAEQTIPEPLLGPIEFRLAPANRLTIELRPPAGADPAGFRVCLEHPERLFEPEGEDRDDLFAHLANPHWWVTRVAPGGDIVHAGEAPDRQGLVVFRALRPGVELKVVVESISGNVVFHEGVVAPLSAVESRRLLVELDPGLRAFRGRVLDAAGLPLVRAQLQIGNQILDWTDGTGSFEAFTTTAEPQTLLVSHETCATLFLPDYVIPGDGIPVEFQLQPALTIRIEVVDEDGAPVLGAEVYTRRHGFTTNAVEVAPGRFEASRLSPGQLEIMTRVMGRTLLQPHDPAIPTARVVVPFRDSGKVRVELAGTRSWSAASSYMLSLHPKDPDAADPQHLFSIRPELGSFEFAVVPPGDYAAVLFAIPSPEEQAAGRQMEQIATAGVTVERGQESRVVLEVGAG